LGKVAPVIQKRSRVRFIVKILVDADACPVVVREILFRAAVKREIKVTLFANQSIRVPASPFIGMYQVPQGFDAADDEIALRAEPGDLVITADIPLASEVLPKGARVLTPRGERYTENNIKQRLQMRDFMETMRSSGEHTGGPAAMNQADRKAFADQLDRLLTAHTRQTHGSGS
jgi:uncharacterized protein YaiI (UPF0178 family)